MKPGTYLTMFRRNILPSFMYIEGGTQLPPLR